MAGRSGRSSSWAWSSSRTWSATVHDQIWFLVLFSMAALFLLTRLHALDERATWVRRRIGDPATVGSLYLRGGTVFILVAIFGALDADGQRPVGAAGQRLGRRPAVLVDVSQWLQRIIPAAPDSRSIGFPSFGQQVTIGGVWSPNDDPALVIRRKSGDTETALLAGRRLRRVQPLRLGYLGSDRGRPGLERARARRHPRRDSSLGRAEERDVPDRAAVECLPGRVQPDRSARRSAPIRPST